MEFKNQIDRIFLPDENGRVIAEVLFPIEPDGIHNITHTVVDQSLQGQGVAGKLMKAAAEAIRAEGAKTRLTCSYAVKWFGKHPEYNDILADKAGCSCR
ncbi:MAG: GNAT family N-acetyltransferase [Anaerovoracaceae bacterium]|nr:GNAT family N-acetyltransferase [Anaerovoracaceae bacterium]